MDAAPLSGTRTARLGSEPIRDLFEDSIFVNFLKYLDPPPPPRLIFSSCRRNTLSVSVS